MNEPVHPAARDAHERMMLQYDANKVRSAAGEGDAIARND